MRKRKQYKMTKKDWLIILEFWPLSIMVPSMLILILLANIFGWGG
tara:strand:- start:1090 stop:1224 length:135 start_codon:yes stop_codon:yes gene_type:complete